MHRVKVNDEILKSKRISYTINMAKREPNKPCSKHAKGTQYTPSGSSYSPIFPARRTTNSTKIKSFMSPTQSNGSDSLSCHIGLKPLFLMTYVLNETVLADETLVVVASVEGEYLAPAAVAVSGRKGECDQSGICSDTSTKGSTADLSCPLKSRE